VVPTLKAGVTKEAMAATVAMDKAAMVVTMVMEREDMVIIMEVEDMVVMGVMTILDMEIMVNTRITVHRKHTIISHIEIYNLKKQKNNNLKQKEIRKKKNPLHITNKICKRKI
jgi:hypothetical protein